MAVHHVRTDEDDRSRRDFVPADLVRTLRGPADDPRRGIEAHRLLQDPPRLRELRQVIRGRIPPTEHLRQLGPELAKGGRIAGEQQPGEGQRVGGGLVAGEKDRHRLVAKLAVVHRLAGFGIARPDQHREQIGAVRGALPPLGDHPHHHRVERRQGAAEPPVLAGRNDGGQVEHATGPLVGEPEQEAERSTHLVGRVRRIVREQRLADDAQCQAHHLVVYVHVFAAARLQLGRGVVRGAHHRGRESRDALAVERWLRDAPLPFPGFTLAGEQTVAEHVAEIAVSARLLAVVLVVLDQDVVGAFGRADEVADHRTEAEAHHLAVVAEGVHEEGDGIAPRPREVSEQELAAGPRRAVHRWPVCPNPPSPRRLCGSVLPSTSSARSTRATAS